MKSRVRSYLGTITFKREYLNGFAAQYLSNIRIPILIILSLVLIGTISFLSVQRRLNPEIRISIVIVSTVLPGASPDDVEQLVTIPLEQKLSGVDGLDTMASQSRESVSVITLQFVSGKNSKEAETDVQSLVNQVKTLPDSVQSPQVAALDFENQPVWTFAVTGPSDTASLMRFAADLKTKVEAVSLVDRVETSGLDDENIEVIVDPAKAADFGINPIQIAGLLKSAASALPAGPVNSSTSVFSLTINKQITTVDDIRNLELKNGSNVLRLGDIANISERPKSGTTSTYIAAPQSQTVRAVQFFVFKKRSADINKSFRATEPVVRDFVAKYPGRFTLYSIMNTSELVDRQFGDLNREFINTSLLVFVLLLLFLGIRQGIISNVTVPLTFLGTFAVIYAAGLTLNFLTVFSLLLTLGILIDDTIVVVAAMTRYYKTGKFTPYETGILVWKDFWIPLWSSAITTIWGFVPLLLSTGIIGEFIRGIPIVVTTSMLLSTIISTFITIPLMIVFLKPQAPKRVKVLLIVMGLLFYVLMIAAVSPRNMLLPVVILLGLAFLFVIATTRDQLWTSLQLYARKRPQLRRFKDWALNLADHGIINIERLSRMYRVVIENILRSRTARRDTVIAIAVFTVVAYLLVPAGLVKNEFFPKADEELLYVSVDLPPGTNNDIVTREAQRMGDLLRGTEETQFVVAEVGSVFLSTGRRQQEPDAILFTLHLTKPEKRALASGDLAQRLRDRYGTYDRGVFTVVEVTGGPPAGADIQIQLLGDDLGVLDGFADKVIAYLKDQPGVVNIDKSVKPGTSKVVFVPDKQKITAEGLSVDQIGLALRTYASGFTLDSIRFAKDEEDIVMRTNAYNERPLENITQIQVANPSQQGKLMPLSALGTFRLENNPTVIIREDEKRSITVFAAVTPGVNIPQKNAELLQYAHSLVLPEGYEWKTGGVNEENQKSVTSILQAMGLAFLLILVTMVIEFGSFRQAFIAMLMIPISVAGVLYIFALVRTPLSFAALIGILALFGIVMRHAIVVMEKINENRKHGLSLHDSIADAASSRLEPVLLTSLATIVALIPITISDPFWRGLGGSIIAGLLFTGTLKLFIVPVLYYNFFKDEK